jgi:predicted DNA-binding transcriptional regulator AlpA
MVSKPSNMRSEALWSILDLAEFLGTSVRTVYGWRLRGVGPPPVKIGGLLRWRPADVHAWVESQKR